MAQDFFHFLECSPSVYHASRKIKEKLLENDFFPLSENEPWKLELGKEYFVEREDCLLAAFRMPLKKPSHAVILASHIDSPALKLKPRPEHKKEGICCFTSESYGAPILHTWFDRDLAIAGRIIVETKEGKCLSKIVHLDDYPLIIPSLAIHLDRGQNEKGFTFKKQEHLRAIYSLSSKQNDLIFWLKKHHPFHKLLSFDLFLVPLEKPSFIGFENEMIASYRIDNLSSGFASLCALLESKASEEKVQMALFWDSEEIGSKTFTGADSHFNDQVLERICLSCKMTKEEFFQLKADSLCLSIDVAHSLHPNYPDKYDPDNSPVLGEGPIVKYSPKYATSAASAAAVALLAEQYTVPLQDYASRSDLSGGSTVGAIMAASLGIQTVDIGIGCWGMHSIRETMATQDLVWLTSLLKAALKEPIVKPEYA